MLIHYPLNKASFLKIRNIFPIIHGIISEKSFASKQKKLIKKSVPSKKITSIKKFKRK